MSNPPNIFAVLMKLKTAHSLLSQQKEFAAYETIDPTTLKQIQVVALDLIEMTFTIKDINQKGKTHVTESSTK